MTGGAAIADVARSSMAQIPSDAPPLLRFGDRMVLCAKVDAMVVPVKIDTACRVMLSELHRTLQTIRAIKLGFIAPGAVTDDVWGYAEYAGAPKQQQVASLTG